MKLDKLIPAVAVAALAIGASQAAGAVGVAAAPVPTGTWSGTTSQDLANLDDPYTTKIVITALKGRVLGIVATVRMECPEDAILDARAVKSFKIGRGPLISAAGGFSARFAGVYGGTISITGHLGRRGASGAISANAPTCSGKGSWAAKRRY